MSDLDRIEVYVPELLRAMPGEYSLGVPIADGAVQVRIATNFGSMSRLHVTGTTQEVEIEREDAVDLQAEAYDHNLGITPIFAEPIGKLTMAYIGIGENRSPHMWMPVTEGLRVISKRGLEKFMVAVAKESYSKKVRAKLLNHPPASIS